MLYKGPSMNPTLQNLDTLRVIPYGGKKILAGDVVVFVPPDGEEKVVHRVVLIDAKGIRTRGDNNRGGFDRWLLQPNDIIGRVTYAQQGKRLLNIYGGLAGQLYLISIKARHIAYSFISFIIGPYYRWLADAGIFKGLIKTRLFAFERPAGKELQILIGDRLIGRRLPGRSAFHIKRPFRLFIPS